MITETLLNSLKSLFSSLGAKKSDNNYAVGLFDKTNGEPKGMMGMSDLASVLGGVFDESNVDTNDCNTVSHSCIIGTSGTTTNRPDSSSFVGGVLITIYGKIDGFQFWYNTSTSALYYRRYRGAASSSWKQISIK